MAATPDQLTEIVRDIERLPPSVVAQFILNRDDPIVNVTALVKASSISDAEAQRILESMRAAASTYPYFWKTYVTTCFPNVTRLPDDMTPINVAAESIEWRNLAIRIFDILASLALTDAFTDAIDDAHVVVPAFGTNEKIVKTMNSALNCRQAFGRVHEFNVRIEHDGRHEISPQSDIVLVVLAEACHLATFSYDHQMENRYTRPMTGIRLTSFVDNEIGNRSPDDVEVVDSGFANPWGYQQHVIETYIINSFELKIRLNPQAFIRDALFTRLVAKHRTLAGGNAWRYQPAATNQYRHLWNRVNL